MHEIAKAGAVQCFGFIRKQFVDSIWFELIQERNETEEYPSDTAVLAGQNVLFQMFKGYRDQSGVSSLSWLAAQATTTEPSKYFSGPLLTLFCEAQHDKVSQAQQQVQWTELMLADDDCILELGSSSDSEIEQERLETSFSRLSLT